MTMSSPTCSGREKTASGGGFTEYRRHPFDHLPRNLLELIALICLSHFITFRANMANINRARAPSRANIK